MYIVRNHGGYLLCGQAPIQLDNGEYDYLGHDCQWLETPVAEAILGESLAVNDAPVRFYAEWEED